MDRKQKAVTAGLVRRHGTPEGRAYRKAEQAKQKDWRGRCRKCGAELEGSLEELKGHVCG